MTTLSERLYDHFQREHAVFKRWSLILVSLCAFFVFVFVPYISTKHELDQLQQELHALEAKIAGAQQEITTSTEGIKRASQFLGDASAFEALYEEAKTWVQDLDGIEQKYDSQSRRVTMLRDALPRELQDRWRPGNQPNAVIMALTEARPEVMRHYADDKCFFKIELDWMKCQVRRKLNPISTQLDRVLYDRTTSHEYTQELKNTLQTNSNRYNAGFENAVAREELVPWVEEYLEQERKIIRQWHEYMADLRSALTRKAEKQSEQLAQSIQKREALELSRKELSETGRPQTPFGPLPLTFKGILVLLPPLLMLTAILLVRSQHRLGILRAHYTAAFPAEGNEQPLLNLIMPLAPDPADSISKAVGVYVGFALPAILALIGAKLLLSVPELAIYGERIIILGIVPVMSILLMVFLVYLGRLVIAWRSLNPERGHVERVRGPDAMS